MTPAEALKHLAEEFVGRFGCDAESCTEEALTHEAMLTLVRALGLTPEKCPSAYCKRHFGWSK